LGVKLLGALEIGGFIELLFVRFFMGKIGTEGGLLVCEGKLVIFFFSGVC
jgi:hypothetical protein